MRNSRGFTLIELMIVIVVIGILAAIAIPNFVEFLLRAKEASLKSNMHTFQVAVEDLRLLSDSTFADNAGDIAPRLPGTFINPFDRSVGLGNAWEDRSAYAGPPTARPGITSYADSALGQTYNVKGYGSSGTLPLVLTGGS